ncbi:MAG: 4'-phosphopantetheinyl transferase superfamily protein [Proteobacteria bacterium]|nr:4'-phosphopantetheinyl transferase superfamily protein [Pseudomonadota bacterium]NDC23631.1 4'-phosphopantetheinyl transferase superfamily protein [Pseudomonadota bacterium]NDD03773.1 4'-phosphopantetheinyl transferase superfamily protein [Pseudomonadota bacterium]NDG26134.1 4'-phosphopantetheinyl transferase superfamily protein [Pseudomonadota bacterium]
MNETQSTIFDFSKKSLAELRDASSGYLISEKTVPVFKNEKVYRSFWGGRCALAHLLKQNNLTLRISPNECHGFLELVSKEGVCSSNWFCSISHTDSIAVAALSPQPVGIDIEPLERSVDKVVSRIASATELKEFQQSLFPMKKTISNPHLLIWTGKEAFSKAVGLGMKKGLEDFRIHWANELPFKGSTEFKSPHFLREPTLNFIIHNEFLIGLCCEKDSSSFYFG